MKFISTGRVRLIALILIAISLYSCSQKLQFLRSTVVPAAEGKVKIKKDDNKNYALDLNIVNLAGPEKLLPPKKHYLVWMETERNTFKNLGQLKSSDGLFSNKLKASLSTVTPFQPKRIFITAENDATINYPYGVTVLTTKEL